MDYLNLHSIGADADKGLDLAHLLARLKEQFHLPPLLFESVVVAGGRGSAGEGLHQRLAFHHGRDIAGNMGDSEEFSTQGRQALPSARPSMKLRFISGQNLIWKKVGYSGTLAATRSG